MRSRLLTLLPRAGVLSRIPPVDASRRYVFPVCAIGHPCFLLSASHGRFPSIIGAGPCCCVIVLIEFAHNRLQPAEPYLTAEVLILYPSTQASSGNLFIRFTAL
jgi:hypothetical protein